MRAIYCAILLFSFIKVEASNLDSLFSKANSFYQNEQYESSIILYDSILTLGYESEEIYFNLGNCYYLKGNIPKSILNFEKSLVLNPNNLEAKTNLEITHNRIAYLEELPQLFTHKWWNYFTDIFSLKTWSIVLMFFTWISCLAIYFFFANKKRKLFNAILILVTISLISSVALKSKINSNKKLYAILDEKSSVYEQSNTNSILSEVGQGNKTQILKQENEWAFVRFNNGLQAWIKMESLLII